MCLKHLCISTVVILIGFVHVAHSASLRCYRGSLIDYDEAPLSTAETLLSSSCYNSSLKNAIYSFGFRGKTDGPATNASLEALIKLNDRNVLLFNWQTEASSVEFFGNFGRMMSYVFSALPNTILVGNSLGQALIRMSEKGFNLNRTHLIAHSLGAQVFGYAGRYMKNRGKVIDRITGLDPAHPFFDQPQILTPLGSDCAKFVDSIHTDPGGYGLNSSHATVDIYMNYKYFITGDATTQVQPACPIGSFEMFTDEDLCSHNRAWMLQNEAYFHPDNLQASKAPTYAEWANGVGGSTAVLSIGDDIDRSASGNFYMSTNGQSPFGKGADGLYP